MKYVIRLMAFGGFLAFATAQIAAGYCGIAQVFGHPCAVLAVLAAVFLRFTLPITVGAFFGAMQLWGWHWSLALAFCIPGLFFTMPGSIGAVLSLSRHGGSKLTSATPICAEH
jgi:hypothetical protein